MGAEPYKILKTKFKNLTFQPHEFVLEIGSDWWDCHSKFLHFWSYINDTSFISVDVIEYPKTKHGYLGIDFRTSTSGSDWCRDELPKLNKKIKVLYLDNFDWIWNPENIPAFIQEQIDSYAKRGVVMNNDNCKEEHRLQVERCLPFMAEQSLVIMDDTFPDFRYPSGWSGKCGSAIGLLKEHGYIIKEVPGLGWPAGAYAYKNLTEN